MMCYSIFVAGCSVHFRDSYFDFCGTLLCHIGQVETHFFRKVSSLMAALVAQLAQDLPRMLGVMGLNPTKGS